MCTQSYYINNAKFIQVDNIVPNNTVKVIANKFWKKILILYFLLQYGNTFGVNYGG